MQTTTIITEQSGLRSPTRLKLYGFNYDYQHQVHSGQCWAPSSFDIERDILSKHPHATGIDIWLIS
jgi:hypothetical protein